MRTTFRREGPEYVLLVDRTLDHAPSKVWRAVTEHEALAQWFPARVNGEWVVGAPLRFAFEPGLADDLSDEELRGEVLRVDPPRLLEFRWGSSLIRFEIEASEGGARFRLSERQADPSWGARNAAGWEMCIENLDLVLDGIAAAKFVAAVWRAKFKKYAAEFEEEFGPQDDPSEASPRLRDDSAD